MRKLGGRLRPARTLLRNLHVRVCRDPRPPPLTRQYFAREHLSWPRYRPIREPMSHTLSCETDVCVVRRFAVTILDRENYANKRDILLGLSLGHRVVCYRIVAIL